MVEVLFLIVLFLLVVLVWSVLVNIWAGVPYIASPTAVTKAMVELAQPKAGETVFDLGAGDGRLLRRPQRAQGKGGRATIRRLWLAEVTSRFADFRVAQSRIEPGRYPACRT